MTPATGGASKGGVLLSLTGWPTDAWLNEVRKAAPDRPVVERPDGPGDASIRYAVENVVDRQTQY